MSDFSSNSYTDADRLEQRVEDGRHRKVIGGRWDQLGNLQLDFLRQRGLRPHHAVLDVGCGSLRAGVKLVPYLEPGNYYGIDLNDVLIEAGYEREIVPAGLDDRLPRANLAVNDSFDASGFDRRFDFAIAHSVFTHVPWNDIRLCLEMLCDVMADDGSFFATYFELPEDEPSRSHVVHAPGDLETSANADPYHYRVSDLHHACRGLPWRVHWHGEWGHPRGQKMMWFAYDRSTAEISA
jgi:SAM-dependent methyltransferase